MPTEKQPSPESITTATNELIRRLAFQNIRAVAYADGEEPQLVALDGALDGTESAGNDDDIALTLQQVQKLFPQFTFEYNFQGSIAIHNRPQQIQ